MRNFVKGGFLLMTALLPAALTAAEVEWPQDVILPMEVVYSCNVRWGEGFDHFTMAMGGSGPTDRNQVTITADGGAVFKGSYSAHIIQGHTRLTGYGQWSISGKGDHGVVNLSLIDGFGLRGNGKANIDGAAKDFFVKCAPN